MRGNLKMDLHSTQGIGAILLDGLCNGIGRKAKAWCRGRGGGGEGGGAGTHTLQFLVIFSYTSDRPPRITSIPAPDDS